jgi:hypothetical protein
MLTSRIRNPQSPSMVRPKQSSLGLDLLARRTHFCGMDATPGMWARARYRGPRRARPALGGRGGVDVVVLKAGTPSTWVKELLRRCGARAIVADPRKRKAVTDSVRRRDVRDARKLAGLGLADKTLLSPTCVHPPEDRRDPQGRSRTATILEIRAPLKVEWVRLAGGDADDLHPQEEFAPAEFAPLWAPQ